MPKRTREPEIQHPRLLPLITLPEHTLDGTETPEMQEHIERSNARIRYNNALVGRDPNDPTLPPPLPIESYEREGG